MRPIIEFCVSNMHFGTDEVMEKLEENPDYDVIEYGCLNNCGLCSAAPYALVNGEIVEAESADKLYELIMNKIKEMEAWDALDFDLD
ncbi:UDP-N-acetylmuramoylalanine--D-glutamate ligase [Paenibacillus yonginensis]|uniref:UDP-N-acetylmuramoylalanine--D-glutamate ligase n=1 Tax=Paenibacillus yonginensis TaxID=1462996 RepID=A0A1B1N2J5_9BACL|nr:YuzB family protein [Paenibacillus yonginensis]ANS75633.1 UDP-N-acetylmuramoylalanine--D-glutamate ligase [Paenibacillus yonginensis]